MLRFLLRFLGLACLISQGRVMTNNALIYRRPSKWPIAAALTAAVLIHLSAVAIAFNQESRLVAVGMRRRSCSARCGRINHMRHAAAILPGAASP